MLTRLARVTALTVMSVAVAVTMSARPVHADQINPVPVYCDQNPVPGCIVRAATAGQHPDPGSGRTGGGGSTDCHDPSGAVVPCFIDGRGSLGSDGCYYQPFDNSPPPAGASGPGSWYVRSCHDPVSFGPLGVPLAGNMVWLPNAAAPVSPAVLAQQALSRLQLPSPVIRLNPAPPATQISFVPTWLWLDGGSWGSRSATASVPGLSVTATARAARLVVSTGDGATVTCQGPGTAWRAGMDPNAPSPTCGTTYTRPGSYTLTATVTWNVSWAGGGATGTVPALTTTAAVTVAVVDAPALNG